MAWQATDGRKGQVKSSGRPTNDARACHQIQSFWLDLEAHKEDATKMHSQMRDFECINFGWIKRVSAASKWWSYEVHRYYCRDSANNSKNLLLAAIGLYIFIFQCNVRVMAYHEPFDTTRPCVSGAAVNAQHCRGGVTPTNCPPCAWGQQWFSLWFFPCATTLKSELPWDDNTEGGISPLGWEFWFWFWFLAPPLEAEFQFRFRFRLFRSFYFIFCFWKVINAEF